MKPSGRPLLFLRILSPLLLIAFATRAAPAQQPVQKTVEKPSEKKVEKADAPEKTENPAQIELLETRYRFEANGDSRKEVHTRVHINSELGVRQFARLNFDYNRSFQSIEIPLVRITHPSGGTADILPSAITDQPNPAVINAPAYQDLRVKSVRILGLAPATTSNTAPSPPLRTIPSPRTSGLTTPSTAPASSPKKSSNSIYPHRGTIGQTFRGEPQIFTSTRPRRSLQLKIPLKGIQRARSTFGIDQLRPIAIGSKNRTRI